MKNNENSQSAVIEREGLDAIAHQLRTVAEGDIRDLLLRARILRRKIWLFCRDGRNFKGVAVVIISAEDNYSQLLLSGKKLASKVQLHLPTTELLLLLSPDESFVVGIVLTTGESFSTKITVRKFPNSADGGMHCA